ncbi:MAG TPA: VOC family protein [Gemmataceae bacterium]|nr:VOC family protein [Gemmataceae bacterium]
MAANDEKPKHYGVDQGLARHGHVSYLEIPAVDAEQSAAFYEAVFGWTIHRRDSGRRSFDDGSGAMIGAWVTGRPATRQPGLVPYIYVNNVDEIVARTLARGGEIEKPPYPEGDLWVATFRDPAGNVMGIWQAGPR